MDLLLVLLAAFLGTVTAEISIAVFYHIAFPVPVRKSESPDEWER